MARLEEGEAREVVNASFAEMRTLGIDFNLAPVVDLNLNSRNPNIGVLERSFSADPNEVRRCVAIFNSASRRVGLGLCLKHYPGIGGAVTDSHLELTDLSETISDEQIGLFTELCDVILGGAIVLSHGFVKEWDPVWPVSVSTRAIGSLRRTVPRALLITDDVQMNGLRHFGSTVEMSIRALQAGVDLVCIGNNLLAEETACVDAAKAARALMDDDSAARLTLCASQERVAIRKAA
jgi:beta-N-acetylhexosaminidase